MTKNKPKRKKGLLDAYKKHQNRTKRSRKADESRTSKIIYNDYNKKWSKNPASSDVRGIDTKKHKARNYNEVIAFMKGNASINKVSGYKSIITCETNFANRKQQLQRIVNTRFNNIKIVKRKAKNTPKDYRILINN